MSYVTEHGIPHSEFLKWSAEDRSKTLAFIMEKSLRCTQCGTAEWEWKESRFAYTPVEEHCHGCYLISVYRDTESNQKMPGTNVKLLPTTPELKAQMFSANKRRSRIESREREKDGEDGRRAGRGPSRTHGGQQ